jgi:hypothetical protein
MGKPKYPLTGVAIEPSLKQEIKDVAASLGILFNEAVEQALIDWLNRQ